MKRPLALLLAAALLFALCACGAQPDALTQPQTTEPTTAAPTSAVPTTRKTTTEPAAEPTAAEPAAFSPDDVAMTKTPNAILISMCPRRFGRRFAPLIRSAAITTPKSRAVIPAKRDNAEKSLLF